MVELHLKLFNLVILWFSLFLVLGSSSWCPHRFNQKATQTFQKRTERFWEFDRKSNSWVEVDLPYDLVSCVNHDCTRIASIDSTPEEKEKCSDGRRDVLDNSKNGPCSRAEQEEGADMVLKVRKRISLTRMSETSVWATGESGSIYERFWNGVQWVIAPHDLPASAGAAVSVFLINQTILAQSEEGKLYQLHLSESSQLVWLEFKTTSKPNSDSSNTDSSSPFQIRTGSVSYNGERAYFAMMNGSLLELSEIGSERWIYHGHPPGEDVVAIADAAAIRPNVVFTLSSSGYLYEFDRSSKPSWKKHVQNKGSTKETFLAPSKGCVLFDLVGVHSISLFLLTKAGNLVERRLHQRKWRWVVHGAPKEHHLASITAVEQDELTDKFFSLFFTTRTGSVIEYRLPKHSGVVQDKKQVKETWVNHTHPPHAKAARGIPGLQIQTGRILFSLDDGRLAELHISGIGGETSAPTQSVNLRRKSAIKYEWTILDSPETEGWNAEYCTEERGSSNCITGMKDEASSLGSTRKNRRKGRKPHESYLVPSILHSSPDEPWGQNKLSRTGISSNFRMRVMQEGRSYFFISENGSIFEYLYVENIWLWLRHEHLSMMEALVGNYNGSLYLVDTHGNLLIREQNENELAWVNATGLRKGRQVAVGPPWDKTPGKARKITAEDALFFVSKTGRLLQFTVALRKFKWKDCRKPPNTKIAYIVDQEMFRDNIVFAVGRNGKLYQYNKVAELWHEHLQSRHLILSRMPGTAMRLSSQSLTGSIFMIAEDGGLIEYHWRPLDGWNWLEHGTPHKDITFVGAPGPCVEYNRLFLIGSDGEVYLRYMDHGTWKWKSYGFPSLKDVVFKDQTVTGRHDKNKINCVGEATFDSFETYAQYTNGQSNYCDSKVAAVRPILFSEDSMIFELRDGTLAELRRTDDIQWAWSRIIGTPTSLCLAIHSTAMTF